MAAFFVYAQVAEWQTRRAQNPLPQWREGSTPSLSTHQQQQLEASFDV